MTNVKQSTWKISIITYISNKYEKWRKGTKGQQNAVSRIRQTVKKRRKDNNIKQYTEDLRLSSTKHNNNKC